jgi:hypothetical protein
LPNHIATNSRLTVRIVVLGIEMKRTRCKLTFCLGKLVIYEGTKDLERQICPDNIMGTVILLKLIMFTFEHYGLLVCDFVDG